MKLIRLKSGSVISVKNTLRTVAAIPPKEEPVVNTDTTELSKKLSTLQIGGNVLAKKKYISF
jgi:hypothetical protein